MIRTQNGKLPGVPDQHSETLIAGGGVFAVVGGALMAVGVTEASQTHDMWTNIWFDTGLAFVVIGTVVAVIGTYLHFRRRKAPPPVETADPRAPERPTALPLPVSVRPLQPYYRQREPYRQPKTWMFEHRIGIRNPPGNPTATGVRLEWTDMSPRPANHWGYSSVVPPQPVPRQTGGDPAIGIPLTSGQEELWVIATTGTASDGTMSAGVFGVEIPPWRGMQWSFKPGDRWRFTYRITVENVPDTTFSVVMTAVDGTIRCDLEG
jgi:hypothetical protein